MLADEVDVVVGVDTHKHTHTAAVVSTTGVALEHLSAPTTPAGYRKLLEAARPHPGRRLCVLEGTGSYGARLSALLLGRGEAVVEIDRPARPGRRHGAKSDELDAVRAAREALARGHLGTPRQRGEREAVRVLLATRRQAVDARTKALNALHALVTSAPEPLRARLRHLPTGELVRTCARLRGSERQPLEHHATVLVLRSTARRVLACEAEAAEHEELLAVLVAKLAPQLLEPVGVGVVTAARVLASWSHRGRLRSEAAFAALAGVAPVPASSGQVVRHRLNRSGDRQLNRALHTIVLTRLRIDPTTQAYAARRQAEGLSPREVRRCLKRYVARQLYRALEARSTPRGAGTAG